MKITEEEIQEFVNDKKKFIICIDGAQDESGNLASTTTILGNRHLIGYSILQRMQDDDGFAAAVLNACGMYMQSKHNSNKVPQLMKTDGWVKITPIIK